MKPWIIGEANPYGADPYFAMYPDPPQSAGGRLCFKILGMTEEAYLESFERHNLCPMRWSAAAARDGVARIRARSMGAPTILLGAKVAKAFGYEFRPWSLYAMYGAERSAGCPWHTLILPHPSGLCRLWSTVPGAIQRTREDVARLCPHLVPLLGANATPPAKVSSSRSEVG